MIISSYMIQRSYSTITCLLCRLLSYCCVCVLWEELTKWRPLCCVEAFQHGQALSARGLHYPPRHGLGVGHRQEGGQLHELTPGGMAHAKTEDNYCLLLLTQHKIVMP